MWIKKISQNACVICWPFSTFAGNKTPKAMQPIEEVFTFAPRPHRTNLQRWEYGQQHNRSKRAKFGRLGKPRTA